jgi:hypothetical protein
LDSPEHLLIREQLEAQFGSGLGNMGMWTLQFGNITKQQCRLQKTGHLNLAK